MSTWGRNRLLIPAVMAIACASPSRAGVHAVRPASAEVAQIVDASLAAVLAPDRELSGVSVAERTIRFDHARTLSAFGHPGMSLRLTRDVTDGSIELVADCRQVGGGSCSELGLAVYAWVAPVSTANSEAVVRVWAYWPSRTGQAFEQRTAPAERAILVGFGMDVHLNRDAAGRWVFVRTGTAIVS
jgi:hypothetical protein